MCVTKDFGTTIKNIRTNWGMSQGQFAEKIGFNRSFIGSVERGDHTIKLDTLEKFAKALRTSPSQLLSEVAITPTPSPDPTSKVVVDGPAFLQMIKGCLRYPDNILKYLERSGVEVIYNKP